MHFGLVAWPLQISPSERWSLWTHFPPLELFEVPLVVSQPPSWFESASSCSPEFRTVPEMLTEDVSAFLIIEMSLWAGASQGVVNRRICSRCDLGNTCAGGDHIDRKISFDDIVNWFKKEKEVFSVLIIFKTVWVYVWRPVVGRWDFFQKVTRYSQE